MSKLTFDEICFGGLKPETFKKDIEETTVDGKCRLQARRSKTYHLLRAFIDAYNAEHPDDVTSLDEVFMILVGRPYKAPRRPRGGERKPPQINHNNRERKPLDDAELFARLDVLKDENGVINFSKDYASRRLVHARAVGRGLSKEEYLRSIGYEFSRIYKKPVTAHGMEERIADILACADEDGNITLLSKRSPVTQGWLNYRVKAEGRSFDEIINELLGAPAGTYHYVGRQNSDSKYRTSSKSFIGRDPETFGRVSSYIRAHMDQEGYVSRIRDDNEIYSLIWNVSLYSGMNLAEALQVFVPEAKYKKTKKYINESDVNAALAACADETGCVDSAKADGMLMWQLEKRAKTNGRTIKDELESLGFHFSRYVFEVDRIEYVARKLATYFDKGGDAQHIYQVDPELYGDLRSIRQFFPSGSLASMEETVNMFGYTYSSARSRQSKVNRGYVEGLLKRYLPDRSLSVEIMPKEGDLVYALVTYAASKGQSLEATFAEFGYRFSGVSSQTRLLKKRLSAEEYEKYITSCHESEPGDED